MKNNEKRAFNRRRFRFGATATVVTVVVVIAVILLNVIMGVLEDRFPISLDITKDQVFTLSEESREITGQVKNPVEIVVFYDEASVKDSQDGVNYYNCKEYDTMMREFYESLRQYEQLTDGKVTYKFVNPNLEPAAFAAYADYGVAIGDVLFLCGDSYRLASFTSLMDTDLGYSSVYNAYTYSYFYSRVERVLGANILSLQSGQEQIVQVLVGHEEDRATISGLQAVYSLNGYLFEEMAITGASDFDKNAEVALIAAPTTDYSNEEIQRLWKWYYNDGNYGHHLMVYVDPIADCPNLYEFLNVNFKVQVEDSLLLETDPNRMTYYSQLYAMADVADTDYSSHAASAGKLITPLARRISTTLPDPDEDGLVSQYKYIITEYPESAQLIDLAKYSSGDADEKDAYSPDSSEYPLSSMIVSVYNTYNNYTKEKVHGTVLVSGAPEMAYAQWMQSKTYVNESLLLDAVNAITGNEEIVTISNKTLTNDTVEFSDTVQILVGLLLFTVGIPLALLIIGLVVFLRRKNL